LLLTSHADFQPGKFQSVQSIRVRASGGKSRSLGKLWNGYRNGAKPKPPGKTTALRLG